MDPTQHSFGHRFGYSSPMPDGRQPSPVRAAYSLIAEYLSDNPSEAQLSFFENLSRFYESRKDIGESLDEEEGAPHDLSGFEDSWYGVKVDLMARFPRRAEEIGSFEMMDVFLAYALWNQEDRIAK